MLKKIIVFCENVEKAFCAFNFKKVLKISSNKIKCYYYDFFSYTISQ